MPSGPTYTIHELDLGDFMDHKLAPTLVRWAIEVAKRNDPALDPAGFRPYEYLEEGGKVILVRRDDEPVGVICARLLDSVLDRKVRILYQDFLYVKPKNPRVVRILLHWLIDFGRRNANHIITCIAADTNLKPRSLERLGFTKLEELYRLRV